MPHLTATLRRFLDRILVVLGVALLFAIWHRAYLEWGGDRYVATWLHDRVYLFALVAALLAVLGLVRASLATAFAYPIVIIVGELLGSAAWDLQVTFLGDDHRPIHIGWWIAVGLFAWVVLLAAWGDWRARRWERLERRGTTDRREGEHARR